MPAALTAVTNVPNLPAATAVSTMSLSLAAASAVPLAAPLHWAHAPAVVVATTIRVATAADSLPFRFIFVSPILVGLVCVELLSDLLTPGTF